jgi:hypothetical protein
VGLRRIRLSARRACTLNCAKVLGKARIRVLDSASNTTLATLDTQLRFLVASARSTGMKLLDHAATGMALALALVALIIAGGGPISIRKLPDASALALVRWYLVLPPLHLSASERPLQASYRLWRRPLVPVAACCPDDRPQGRIARRHPDL